MLAPAIAGCTDPAATTSSTSSVMPSTSSPVPQAKPSPPRLELLDATLSATTVHPREPVALRFRVQNAGGQDGVFALQLLVNGEVAEEKSYRVFAGAVETGSLEFTPNAKGDYTLSLATSVLGAAGQTQAFSESYRVTVALPADLKVIDGRVSRKEVPVGESIDIFVTIANTGDESGSKDVRLRIEGAVAKTQAVTVAGGARQDVKFTWSSTARGPFLLAVEDYSLGVVTVFKPATFESTLFSVSEERPQVEQAVSATIELRNSGDREGSIQWAIRLGGQSLRSGTQLIGANQVAPKIVLENLISTIFTTPQSLELLLDGKQDRQLIISPKAPSLLLSNVGQPGNSDCSDHAVTSFTISNHGAGRNPSARAYVYVDGKQTTIQGQQSLPIDALEAGQSRTVNLDFDVYDDCGNWSDEWHNFELRIVSTYAGTLTSGVIQFYV